MSGKRKRKTFFSERPYLRRDGVAENFTPLPFALTQSKTFLSMKPSAQILYIRCLEQYQAKPDRQIHLDNKPDPLLFYMNEALWKDKLRLYSDARAFRRDMQTLIQHGFVDCIKDGHSGRACTVYGYSTRWQNIEKAIEAKHLEQCAAIIKSIDTPKPVQTEAMKRNRGKRNT